MSWLVHMYLFKLQFSLDIGPGVRWKDFITTPFLVFWGNFILLSIVVSPVYIPANSVGGSLFLTLSPTFIAAAAAKSLQSCLTICNPIDGSPTDSAVPGILQARTLEWVAISFSKVWKWKLKVKSLSCVWLVSTPWTAAYQASPSMGFSRQGYWSGVPLPSLPTLIMCRLFNDGNSDWCEVVPYCIFDLHFSDN